MNEIEKVLQTYFDASYEGSAEKVRAVFHPAARIYGMNHDASLGDMSLDVFADMVGSSPKNGEITRETEVISIDFTGENTAVARVRLRLGEIVFTDALCLVRTDGQWRIIAKMYSGEIK